MMRKINEKVANKNTEKLIIVFYLELIDLILFKSKS